jgi:thiamine biosynthesis lipoprotein
VILRAPIRAMGTRGELLLDAPDGPGARAALARAGREIARLEGVFSRFLPGSELSRLNRARRMRVGADMARVLRAAIEMRDRTGGRFDPAVGAAVVGAGYDRTFVELGDDPRPPAPAACGGPIALEPASGEARLGPGVLLDLGGLAKGDAADRARDLLAPAGPCLVNLGGDVAVAGEPAIGPWPVGLDGPSGGLTLALGRGGLATSGTDRRRWRRGGRPAHHAIDPRTGAPAETDLVRATAVAATAAEADALATALLVAGEAGARRLARRLRVPAALVTADGRMELAGGLA